jgi:hypothetical protein
MQKVLNGRLAAGLALGGVALWMATTVEARPVVTEPGSECVVTTDVEAIPVQAEPVAVQLRHSEPVGDSVTVTFAEESRVVVLAIAQAEDAENTLQASLNTSEAAAGEWSVSLRSSAGECKGTVVVGAADTEGR